MLGGGTKDTQGGDIAAAKALAKEIRAAKKPDDKAAEPENKKPVKKNREKRKKE